jgi:hypothetical protein
MVPIPLSHTGVPIPSPVEKGYQVHTSRKMDSLTDYNFLLHECPLPSSDIRKNLAIKEQTVLHVPLVNNGASGN